MLRIIPFMIVVFILGACSARHNLQQTSGQSYLSNYQHDLDKNGTSSADQPLAHRIKSAASKEPILSFPSRIGLARFENGNFVDIPEKEKEAWASISKHLPELGELLPLNVLGSDAIVRAGRIHRQIGSGNSIEEIRVAAAAQHLDAVLIYELNARSKKLNTVLAVADVTIVGGAFLPTRIIQVDGNARALLVDVRNGYPYGSATAELDVEKYSTSWGSNVRELKIQNQMIHDMFAELSPEVEEMLEKLVKRQN